MRRLALLAVPLLLAACSSSGPTSPTGRTDAHPPTRSEANVIAGRVTTEPGAPVPGAEIRIVGYTGGATLGREIETVLTGDDGRYRYEVPRGLYEVLGQATLDFDGQSYVFELQPSDGVCEQRMSDDGIVQDFELRLTGLLECRPGIDPENYTSYNGAAIQLLSYLSGTYDQSALVEFVLEPVGPLADGSPGETLTVSRTIGALDTSYGPIEDTWILHDIPLAVYSVSATLVEPGGARTPLFVASDSQPEPTSEVEIRFDARQVLGGYTVPQVQVWENPELG